MPHKRFSSTWPITPHVQYNVPPRTYLDRVASITDPDRRTYAGMVTALDDGVGKVLQALHDNNLTDNTLVFFLSDNGAPVIPHEQRAARRSTSSQEVVRRVDSIAFIGSKPGLITKRICK